VSWFFMDSGIVVEEGVGAVKMRLGVNWPTVRGHGMSVFHSERGDVLRLAAAQPRPLDAEADADDRGAKPPIVEGTADIESEITFVSDFE